MQQVQQNGLVASISGSTLWRWLNEEANRPWYQRSWVFPRDPDFATKAGRVLDLYSRRWRGCGLKEEESPVMMFRRGNRLIIALTYGTQLRIGPERTRPKRLRAGNDKSQIAALRAARLP